MGASALARRSAAVVALVLMASAQGAAEAASLDGSSAVVTVATVDGAPSAGASVTLRDTAGTDTSTAADDAGVAILTGLAPGDYTVHVVEACGDACTAPRSEWFDNVELEADAQPVAISDGGTATVDVILGDPLTLRAVTPPAISGEPSYGSILTAAPGTWSPVATDVAFAWLRDGSTWAAAPPMASSARTSGTSSRSGSPQGGRAMQTRSRPPHPPRSCPRRRLRRPSRCPARRRSAHPSGRTSPPWILRTRRSPGSGCAQVCPSRARPHRATPRRSRTTAPSWSPG